MFEYLVRAADPDTVAECGCCIELLTLIVWIETPMIMALGISFELEFDQARTTWRQLEHPTKLTTLGALPCPSEAESTTVVEVLLDVWMNKYVKDFPGLHASSYGFAFNLTYLQRETGRGKNKLDHRRSVYARFLAGFSIPRPIVV